MPNDSRAKARRTKARVAPSRLRPTGELSRRSIPAAFRNTDRYFKPEYVRSSEARQNELVSRLSSRYTTDGIVLYLGAGIGHDLGFLTWRDLVKELVQRVMMGKVADPKRLMLIEAINGNIKEALAAFDEAQKLDSKSMSAEDWNLLCWIGSLRDQAKEVQGACETAVTLDPDNFHIRDSRGLARALAGDKRGAIEDFEAYVKKAEDADRRSERQAWIAALRQDKNPFTPKLLKTLFSQ